MRLIDADILIEMFAKRRNDSNAFIHDKMIEILKAMPTAYDLDKVVEGLECYISDCNEMAIRARNGVAETYYSELGMAMGKAVEIVKKGGIE